MPQTEAGMCVWVVRKQKFTNLLPEENGSLGRKILAKSSLLSAISLRVVKFQLTPTHGL